MLNKDSDYVIRKSKNSLWDHKDANEFLKINNIPLIFVNKGVFKISLKKKYGTVFRI